MGSHPRTRGLFDFSRKDCDVWLFNEAAKQEWAKRADGVLQLHSPVIFRNPKNRNDPEHYQWLKTTKTPVYMQDKYDDIPASVKFPKDEILYMLPNARANGSPIREVSCSPAWALAFGIYLGYRKIEIYGVELESNTEYSYQQGNWKYWVGVAAGRGIELDIYTTMFDHPLYGYEGEVTIPYADFENRVNAIEPALNELRGKTDGNLIELWKLFDETAHRDTTKELNPKVQEAIGIVSALGEVEGAIAENLRYKDKADTMKEHAGDFVFSRQEFEQGAAAAQKYLSELMMEASAINGQLRIVHDTVVRMAKGSPKRQKGMAAYKNLLNGFLQVNNAIGRMRGAASENFAYMKRLDEGIKAAGGAKSEETILNAMA